MTRERIAAGVRESPGFLPGSAVVLLLLWWAAHDGGFSPLTWLPGSLFLVALATVYVLTVPGGYGGGKPLAIAMIAFAAFTAWSFLTIVWSESPALAWSGSNLTLAYLAVFVLFAWRPWEPAAAAVLIGSYSLGVTLVALATIERAARAPDPLDFFIAGRLASPIAYSNANCALFVSAALPALFLASRREVHWLLRGLFLASVGILVECALMCQSRASLLAVPLVLLIFIAAVPGRMRIVVALVPTVIVVAAIGARPMLDVYESVVAGTDIPSVLDDARLTVLATGAILLFVGAAIGLADEWLSVPPWLKLSSGVLALTVTIAAAAIASVAFVHHYHPVANASTWWDRFSGGSYLYEAGTPHLVSGLGSGRYDIWRVAVDVFDAHPVTGAGVDTFGAEYLQLRTRLDDPIYAHSVELRTLAGTGIIGTILLIVSLAGAGFVAVRASWRGVEFARGIVVAALAFVAYWLIHGSVDWFWEMPVLGATAFAFLGLATSIRTSGPSGGSVPDASGAEASNAPESSADRTRRLSPLVPVVAAAALAGGVSLLLPWLSARDVQVAVRGWNADPQGAFARLDRARSLNPLSDEPDLLAAAIASQLGQSDRQRSALKRAIERNPRNWYPYLELGALEARQGHRSLGLRHLDHARKLDPLEPTIASVAQLVAEGKPPSEQQVEAMLLQRVDLLTGKRQG